MKAKKLLIALTVFLLSIGTASAQSVRGDVNNDGVVNVADITELVNIIMSSSTTPGNDPVVEPVGETYYYWIGTSKPSTANNFHATSTTTFTTLAEALASNKSISVSANSWGVVLLPSSWKANADDLVLWDNNNSKMYTLAKKTTDIANHDYFESKVKIQDATTIYLKKKSDVQGQAKATDPQPQQEPQQEQPTVTPDPQPSNPVATGNSYAEYTGVNGIGIVLHNNTGQTIKFSGKFKPYIKGSNYTAWSSDASQEQELEIHLQKPDSYAGGWPHWYTNPFTLAPGATLERTYTHATLYNGTGVEGVVNEVPISIDNYVGKYFMAVDKTDGAGNIQILAVKLGQSIYNTVKAKLENTPTMLHIQPMKASDAQIRKGYTYHFIIDKYTPDSRYQVQ